MSRKRFTLLLVALLIAITPLFTTTAQGQPATPVPGQAPTGVLTMFEITELPTPHAEVWFIRMGLDPDGSVPLGPQAGPTVLFVESGRLTLETDRPVTLGGEVAADAADMATPAGENQTVLDTGASVLIAEGTAVSARNAAGGPVTFLVLLMYPAEREGEGGSPAEEPVGLTQQGLSVGSAEFQPVPATMTIERVVVEPAGSMARDVDGPDGIWPGRMGIELGVIETGSAEVVFESRTLQNLIWPGITTGGMVEPERVLLTATVLLGQGDGYAAFNSTLSWTSAGDEPLTVLRAVVTPQTQ